MTASDWVSHPEEWQPRITDWVAEFPELVVAHTWTQWGGQAVRGLTLGVRESRPPLRVLVAVPHAHEPAPTAAIIHLAGELLAGRVPDGPLATYSASEILGRCLLTLLPDTNSQGRARSPRRVWDGDLDNDAFLKVAFGTAADGERFGRYPEWSLSEHQPREVGVVYEQLDADLFVEPNTSRRSTHTRAVDELFAQYGYTHHLDMHQHEGDEAALLSADFDDLSPERQAHVSAWAAAVLGAWEHAGIRHKGSYIPYRGLPRQQFFRDYWAGRCPGMERLTTETRNNRHIPTDERTTQERQFRSAQTALHAGIAFLLAQ